MLTPRSLRQLATPPEDPVFAAGNGVAHDRVTYLAAVAVIILLSASTGPRPSLVFVSLAELSWSWLNLDNHLAGLLFHPAADPLGGASTPWNLMQAAISHTGAGSFCES